MEYLAQFTDPEFVTGTIIPWVTRGLTAIIIFVIGRWIARGLSRVSYRMMVRAKFDQMLANFLRNILYAVLLIAVAIAALDHAGVQTTSLLAIFGAAGLAVGLALKDSLSNFSSGVMLIVFRPFKTGDVVEAGGVTGVVEKVSIFNTVMRTGDNREIIVPNSQIYGDTITNLSARDTRRIDLVFGIGYDDDIGKAREILLREMTSHERILDEPAPAVTVAELGDSSVNLNARPWVKTPDYWAVRSDMLERVKNAFDAEGINIPYPQTDVHLHEVKSA